MCAPTPIRASPPHFNREQLEGTVRSAGIAYVFMGEELGGRPTKDDQYDSEGHALYGLMSVDGPTPGRGVIAVACRGGEAMTVASWHALHAVPADGESQAFASARKMSAYSALLSSIDSISGPLVLGFDANHWNLRTDLELADPPDDDDELYMQHKFFSSEPNHRLRDALLDYLSRNPKVHEALTRVRPDGPLEITYKRGGQADRFDYLMISDDLEAAAVIHDYDASIEAGSDHGMVSAVLRRRSA